MERRSGKNKFLRLWLPMAIFAGSVFALLIYIVLARASLRSRLIAVAPPIDFLISDMLAKDRPLPERELRLPPKVAEGDVASQKVDSEKKLATALPAPCVGSLANDFDCYGDYVKKIVRDQGIQPAFAYLRSAYATNPYVRSQCHPLTHSIGQAAVEKFPTIAEAYQHADSFCWSGYHHGALEGFVGIVGREKFLAGIDTICDGIPGKERYSFDYYNCLHGLGHGVMALTQTELFESLEICNRLTGSWQRQSCFSGVFMENVIVDNKNHFTKYLKPAEPLFPCTAVESPYKQTCYLMQTSYMLKVTGQNFAKVFEWCQMADPEYINTCYESLGRDASGKSVSSVTATKATCELGKDFDQRSHCVIGAVKDFISYFHSDSQALQLCAALNPEVQETCRATTVAYAKIL